MRKKILALSLLVITGALFLPKNSFAQTFDLSYSLTEGGYRLELNAVNPYRGVKLNVTSDVSTRYEVIQRIVRPLENRDKPGVTIKDNFVVRGLRGTNNFGTLHITVTDTLVRADEILYTSDTSGTQDSFTLVYGIVNAEVIEPGYYYGKISFTLNPIDSTRLPVTKYLDVYVTVGEKKEVKPAIEITTTTGAKRITLNSKKEGMQAFDVLVKVNGAFKNMFNITQAVIKPLESPEADKLDYEAVGFMVKEVKTGTAINQSTPLSSQSQIIYTSTPSGQADESFVVTFALGDLSKQKAGRYMARIQYFLEEAGAEKALIDTLELEVEIERIFDLVVSTEAQQGKIEFRNLRPKDGPKKNEVIIEIKTNIARQYQVSENVLSEFTDKEGRVIPPAYFTLITESQDTKGVLRFPSKTEVKKGENILFVSDNQGSADKFKVTYELAVPKDVMAGDYSTRITYALLEI